MLNNLATWTSVTAVALLMACTKQTPDSAPAKRGGWIWAITLAVVWFWTFRVLSLWWDFSPAY